MDLKEIGKRARKNIIPLVLFLPPLVWFVVTMVLYCLYSLTVLLDLVWRILAPLMWFYWMIVT